jgi:hypothetical protein
MTELSPAAQAVLDAVASQMEGGWISPEFIPYEARKIAAALRAAADQVVPKEIEPANAFEEEGYVPGRLREQRQETRRKLLAIADQLEAQ